MLRETGVVINFGEGDYKNGRGGCKVNFTPLSLGGGGSLFQIHFAVHFDIPSILSLFYIRAVSAVLRLCQKGRYSI